MWRATWPASARRPALAGVIGDDEPGRHLVRSARRTKDRDGQHPHDARCARPRTRRASAPSRGSCTIISRSRTSSRSCAWTRNRAQPLDPESKQWLFDRLRAEIAAHDAVIFEDYAKGLIDQELVTLVIAEAKKHGKIVAIDPNPNNPFDWSGGTVLKPNRREAFLSRRPALFDRTRTRCSQAGAMLQKRHAMRTC